MAEDNVVDESLDDGILVPFIPYIEETNITREQARKFSKLFEKNINIDVFGKLSKTKQRQQVKPILNTINKYYDTIEKRENELNRILEPKNKKDIKGYKDYYESRLKVIKEYNNKLASIVNVDYYSDFLSEEQATKENINKFKIELEKETQKAIKRQNNKLKKQKLKEDTKKYERGQEFLQIIGSTLTPEEAKLIERDEKRLELKNLQNQFLAVNKGTKTYEKLKNSIIETQNALKQLNQEIDENNKKLKIQNTKDSRQQEINFLNIISETMTDYEKKKVEKQVKQLELKNLKLDLSQVKEGSYEYRELADSIRETQEQLNKLNKELSKGKKVGPIEKLFNTFKRVGFYRIARRFFSYIDQGFGDSLRSLTLFDSGFNDTMSSITSQFQILSSSVMVIVKPALELLEPILENVTKGVVSISNAISYLIAKLKGSAEYYKINTEYMKDFNQQSNLFSFDKFEALQSTGNINPEEMWIPEDIKNVSNLTKDISDFIEILIVGITTLGTLKVFEWILSKDYEKFFSKGGDFFKDITGKLDTINYLLLAISSYKIFDKFLKGASETQKVITRVIAGIIGIASALAIVWSLLPGGSLKVASVVSKIGKIGLATSIPLFISTYANGGVVDSGSLFIAGESGAELVTTMPSGQTGVTNISQFKQAMIEALYEWGGGFGNDSGDVVLNLDGAEIARSRRFTDELNRRNSKFNII